MSEDIPDPSPFLLAVGAAFYLSLMVGAGVPYGIVRLVPLARKDRLDCWSGWFYDGCVYVAEFTIALLLHLRSNREAIRRIRCPRCGARPDVFFGPDGRDFDIEGGCWHLWSNFPLLVSPPGWWRRHIRHDEWGASRTKTQGGHCEAGPP
jgi:hypothetical protein